MVAGGILWDWEVAKVGEASSIRIFLCKVWPEFRITLDPASSAIIDGKVMKTAEKYLYFHRTSIGGVLKTKTAAEAERVLQSPQFDEGKIIEMDEAAFHEALKGAPVAGGIQVEAGAVGTKHSPEPAPPAADVPIKPTAAKGPVRHKVAA